MTIFEYLSVATSIVFSLAIVRLLNGSPYFTARSKRYWIHSAWVSAIAIGIPLVWWNMWAYRQIEDWVFPEFALLLLTPVTLYYVVSTLVPDAPANIESWRAYFFQVRLRLCFAMIFLFVCFAMNAVLLLRAPLFHPLRAVEGASIVLLLTGAFSEDPRVHGFLISVFVCILAAVIAFFFLSPGGFATS